MTIGYEWRGAFGNDEFHVLHAEAFDTRIFDDDWVSLTRDHSLGWATARDDDVFVWFVSGSWGGLVRAWIQDVMVAKSHRGAGIARQLVEVAREHAAAAGCE